MTPRDRLLAIAVAACWGLNFPATHLALEHFPPLFMVAVRFALIAAPTLLFVPRPAVPLRWLLGYGTGFGILQFAFLYLGMRHGMPAGLASLVLQASAPFTVVLGAALLGERLSARQVAGVLVAVGGLAGIAVHRSLTAGLLPIVLTLCGGLGWALGNLASRQAHPPKPLHLTLWMSVVPPLPMLALSLVVEGAASDWHALRTVGSGNGPSSCLGLLYIVVVATVLGSGAWTSLMARYPAGVVAPFSMLVPVFGFATSWLLLGETTDRIELAFGAVVVAGVLTGGRAPKRAQSTTRGKRPAGPRTLEAVTIASVLDRAAEGGRITPDEALLLYTEAPLHALGQAADAVRRRRYPDNIATYIIDRNINYTNVCVTACKFCAFYRAPQHAEGWTHSLDEILRRCGEAVDLGATQIMLQGGHSPELGIEWYEQTFSAIKREYPQLALHSLGASEVVHIGRVSDLDHATVIARLKAAGLDSFAGAGAEILVERPRTAIAPLKEKGEVWLSVMETAHNLGLESTATFMMGTGETNAERIEHLRMIRDVQDRTGGFRSFIPWTYQPENNHLKGRTQATSLEYLRMVAVARLFFDNVNHLQGSWLTTGKDIGQLTLHFGADDLGSVMLEENVVSSAGARHRSNRTELIELIRGAGRVPAQRDTLYRHLVVHRDPADDPVDERVHSHFSSTALPLLPVASAH